MPTVSVPVIIDSLKEFGEMRLLRCIYFYIETDECIPIDMLNRPKGKTLALLVDGKVVVVSPPGAKETFVEPEDIVSLFDAIEQQGHQSVQNGTVWVPANELINQSGDNATKKGQVIRMASEAFAICLAYGRNRIDEAELKERWLRLEDAVHLSPDETRAFWEWNRTVIGALSHKYHDSPGTFVGKLPTNEEEGE